MTKVLNHVTTAEQTIAIEKFVKRFITGLDPNSFTFEDALFYARFNSNLSKATKKDPIHSNAIAILNSEVKKAEEKEIKKLKESEEKIMHHSKALELLLL